MKFKKPSVSMLLRAVLAVAATVAVSLAFWLPLRNAEQSHIRHVTAVAARSVQADIYGDMRSRLLAQIRLARLWSLEERLSRRDWETQAQLFLLHHPGYAAVQWVDSTYRERWMVREAESDLPSSALSIDAAIRDRLAGLMSRRGGDADFLPPQPLPDGKTVRRVVVPIYRPQEFLGFVIAVFEEEKVFDNILRDHADVGNALVVFDGEREVYRMDDTVPYGAWAQDAEVGFSGVQWRIRMWPKAELLRGIESTLPELALLMGSLIGLLLFATLDFARTAHLRSKELWRAHDELELRIRERTAQLQSINQRLEAEVCERTVAEKSLQKLSGRLLTLKDEEQRRIARELHDGTSQLLAALAMDIENVRKAAPAGNTAKSQKLLAQSAELVDRVTAEVRTISYLLHPPILDELGLEGVLPWYAQGFSNRSGIQVNLHVQPDLGRLAYELELTLFRIIQEALTNIRRHSGSPTVEITLSHKENQVLLQIRDHGCGMPPEALQSALTTGANIGVGIAGMRERVRQLGGSLRIESDGHGTAITVVLPSTALVPN